MRRVFFEFGVVDANGKKLDITWDEYQAKKRLMPLYLATAHGSQNSLPQAASAVSKHNIASTKEKSSPQNAAETKKSDISDGSDTSDGVTDGKQHSIKRKHRQVNPIISNDKIREEYADLLQNKEYTVEHQTSF